MLWNIPHDLTLGINVGFVCGLIGSSSAARLEGSCQTKKQIGPTSLRKKTCKHASFLHVFV